MRRYVVFILALAGIFLAKEVNAVHYWSDNSQIQLLIDSTKISIRFDDSTSKNSVLPSIGRIIAELDDDYSMDGFSTCTLSTTSYYDQFLDSLDTIVGVYLVQPYYLTLSGEPAPVGESFVAAFDSSLTFSQIDSIAAVLKTTIEFELTGMQNVYLLNNTDSSGERTLSIANDFYQLSQTRYAHPNFGAQFETEGTPYEIYDKYTQFQYQIKRVTGWLNDSTVWDFAGLSDTTIVAVVDDGMSAHEDLPGSRILEGYDFADGDSVVAPGDQRAHGMACAGIIGASHNTDSTNHDDSTGVISMNPKTLILPLKIFTDLGVGTGSVNAAMAITYAYQHGADVISNSWGGGTQADVLAEALFYAYHSGRNGKGCPVVFAAGNEGCRPDPPDRSLRYPAEYWFCFSVGALTANDTVFEYSNCDSTLDLVAYSGGFNEDGDVWSLDQMSALGVNPDVISDCPSSGGNNQNYNCAFGGTSAAAPVVAGAASLIIAKDPYLSSYEVYEILRGSAVWNPTWDPDDNLPPSDRYGYGLVNAFRAILSLARGDVDNTDQIDIVDLTYLVDWFYTGGDAPFPSELLADCNCDGSIDVQDQTYLIDFLWNDGSPPVKPCFEY